MLTYLARPRGVYTEPLGTQILFPCEVEIEFRFQPGSPFGDEGLQGKTVPLGAKTRLSWNACKGETNIEADIQLAPIELKIKTGKDSIDFTGSSMRINTSCESRAELESIFETYYYGFPAVLAIDFLDAPVVSEVRGRAGEVSFCWGPLDSGWSKFDTVTTKIQEDRIINTFERLKLIGYKQEYGSRRLLAATEYFHIACRLNHSAERSWEFLSESLLNYAKILEILFPSPPQQSIDNVRTALSGLGFEEVEIEALFVPAIAIRNAIDVAHPSLSIFPKTDANTLFQYADAAEDGFRFLLRRLYLLFGNDTLILEPTLDLSPSANAQRVVERLKENLRKYKETGPESIL